MVAPVQFGRNEPCGLLGSLGTHRKPVWSHLPFSVNGLKKSTVPPCMKKVLASMPLITLPTSCGSGVSEPVPGKEGSGQNTSSWPPGVSDSSIGSRTVHVQSWPGTPGGPDCWLLRGPNDPPPGADSGVGHTRLAPSLTRTGWPGVEDPRTSVLTPGVQPGLVPGLVPTAAAGDGTSAGTASSARASVSQRRRRRGRALMGCTAAPA